MNKCHFSKIEKINPDVRESWSGKIFLSFDIDWAHDDVILDCYNLVSDFLVETTWFVTHETDVLRMLSLDKQIELGVHPNFNNLLSGKEGGENSNLVIRKLRELVPTAKTIRSHSLTQNERLVDQFKAAGLTHICNYFIPNKPGFKVYPFSIWDDIVIVPHIWQDNVALKMNVHFPSRSELQTGFHVFNFHPIHVYLNTESLDRYENTRHLHQNPSELIKHRFSGFGTRSLLLQLLGINNVN